ncbi:hypothetical protein [Pararhodospirillum photometricum]|uniref:hypothetical protein n=1 Tax=Pararhodospirillum photometricum TaxID=1084 RepID=UPI0012FEF949|nr:hypothetical protein [Pararhodospirillum photometricum]
MGTDDWWPSDGHDHRVISKEGIYINTKIQKFLESDRINLIIATKGMGKTLLMRVKHWALRTSEGTSSSESSLQIIPSDNSEIDEPQINATLSAKGYSDVKMWKHIWSESPDPSVPGTFASAAGPMQ